MEKNQLPAIIEQVDQTKNADKKDIFKDVDAPIKNQFYETYNEFSGFNNFNDSAL